MLEGTARIRTCVRTRATRNCYHRRTVVRLGV